MEYPIRILHVVRYLEQGGIQNLLMNLYRNIDRQRVQFDFLVCGEGFFDEEVKSLGGRIYVMPYITEIGEKKYKKVLEEFLKKHTEYQIIHSHLNQVSGVVMEVCKKQHIATRIAHAHTNKNTNHLIGKIYKYYLQSKINNNATHFFACSQEAAKWLFKKKETEAILIKNGIDIDKFLFSSKDRQNIRKQYHLQDDIVLIGHVGRFSKVKNHIFLLEIFQEYHKKNQNSVLMMIGDGETKEQIKERIKEMNLSQNIILLESQKEIAKYYSAFDYFVFPSLFEGLGIVLIEAQTAGLKCFASNKVIPQEVNITGNVTFIDLKDGPQKWGEKIPTTNQYERNVIENREYDIKKIAKQLQDFYEKVNG